MEAEDVEGILTDYGAVLAQPWALGVIRDVRSLPNSKSAIKTALKHGQFLMTSCEMSRTEFAIFLTVALRLAAEHSVDGSIHFVCMDWRHLEEILEAGKRGKARTRTRSPGRMVRGEPGKRARVLQ